ncbi:hypothetical protein CQW23_10898 [Capsicum baccatum]|uniref:Serpin domain-containing protein n=1 Tax=Capsicum baccatum TaxID=33114 RepID=A0A2G2X134_CAPBA|nr:hypothetical protein CQW23_10898 [Capsicum baccatum]
MANQEEEKVDSCALVNSRIILKQIQNAKNANTNILLSPLSFHAVLSMTAAGATGHTLNQMLQFLGVSDINELNSKFANMADVIDSNGNGGPDLSFLNGMWVAHTHQLRDSYKDLANAVYKTEPKVVDFKRKEEVVEEVNAWAESASRGLITEILKPKHITVILKVHGNLMKSYQVAKIPYDIGKKDDKKEFSMFIFLPNEKDELPSLLEKVNSDPKFFTQNFRLRREPLDAFYIPKFKFSYTAMKQVIRTMREMGLTLPFDKKCEEITKIMEPHGPFFINRILQKAFIEVNEKGTVAAAVTEEFDDDLGFPMCELPRFVADHPFLFMIREEVSRMVLFTGAVLIRYWFIK